jgi:hypothetical protein
MAGRAATTEARRGDRLRGVEALVSGGMAQELGAIKLSCSLAKAFSKVPLVLSPGV